MLSLDSLDSLNPAQREAVTYEGDEHCLILAGAGSGKTRVLTHRIAWLLSQGVPPRSILAITFTNKAASEMRERAIALIGSDDKTGLHLSTFHSFGSQFIRRYAEYIGLTQQFSIYGESDQKALVKSILEERGFLKTSSDSIENEHKQNKALIDETVDAIAKIKEKGILPSEAKAKARFPDEKLTAQVYEIYETRLIDNNAVDFAGLLLWPLRMIQQFSDIRQNTHRRYRHILVDEFQDTNLVQLDLLSALMGEDTKLTAVGDDDQSIYAWRGADPKAILAFSERFGSCAVFKLEQNYRSTQNIVQAANSLIAHNKRQIPKDVFSRNEEGEKLILKEAYSDKEEAMIVCNEILRLRRYEKSNYGDFAILYRTNAQSRSFEEYLRKQNIPYRIYGGMSFYQRKEIKDILAYFRLVSNPNDEEALKRVINYPARGIGAATVGKIIEKASTEHKSLWSVMHNAETAGVSKATATKIKSFITMVSGWIDRVLSEDAHTLGSAIIRESGIQQDIFSKNDPEDVSRQENVQELLSALQGFVEGQREEGMGEHVNLIDFLQEVSLMSDIESDEGDVDNKVVLMTIHSAKGLEFRTVFVVGLEENIFPSPMSSNSVRGIEEERRLLYVAITRAERHCMLTFAKNRFRYGRMECDPPSRFISEISTKFLKVEGGVASSYGLHGSSRGDRWQQNPHPVATQFVADRKLRIVPPRKEEPPVNPFVNKVDFGPSPLQPGQRIEHQRFGIGKVLAVEGSGENAKATVEFENAGTKNLLLKFAKYKVLTK